MGSSVTVEKVKCESFLKLQQWGREETAGGVKDLIC